MTFLAWIQCHTGVSEARAISNPARSVELHHYNKTVHVSPRKALSLLFLLPLLFVFSCRQVPVVDVEQPQGVDLKEQHINANRLVAQSEENQIDAYLSRRGWQMQRLQGGGRILVTHPGTGKKIDYEDTVAIRYTVETLGGQSIYTNIDDTVVAGRLKPTRGLDQALLTLSSGSTAVVVLPSEQAYGVVGDGDRIGSRTVLVYKVEVRDIKQ